MITPPSPGFGRFAPSPTGPLHWGSVLAAMGSWLAARLAGDGWIIRIEDLDPPREQPGASDAQLATLGRLGMHSDQAVARQSQRHEYYRTALDQLLSAELAFPCLCSRADLEAAGGVHRHCRPLRTDTQRTRSFRFRIPEGEVAFQDAVHGHISQDVGHVVGDVVLRRADGFWAYQLAVVVDDAAQGIRQVVRGADLLDSTPRQILLQRALGLPEPTYAHLPLWLDATGRKLSKSAGSTDVAGLPTEQVLRACWSALGQSPEAWSWRGTGESTLAGLAPHFQIGRVPRQLPVPSGDGAILT